MLANSEDHDQTRSAAYTVYRGPKKGRYAKA